MILQAIIMENGKHIRESAVYRELLMVSNNLLPISKQKALQISSSTVGLMFSASNFTDTPDNKESF